MLKEATPTNNAENKMFLDIPTAASLAGFSIGGRHPDDANWPEVLYPGIRFPQLEVREGRSKELSENPPTRWNSPDG